MNAESEQSEPDLSRDGNEIAKRKCFVITPISDTGTEIRDETDGLMDAVICPVLEGLDFEKPVVSHRLSRPGSINDQVIRMLLQYELVVANLTELNPNVMYELAVRHAIRKPVVMIAKTGTKLPFDLYGERTVPFRNSFSGTMQLRHDLRAAIDEALAESTPDNPIYRVASQTIIEGSQKTITETQALIATIGEMESRILSRMSPLVAPRNILEAADSAIAFQVSADSLDRIEAFRDIARSLPGIDLDMRRTRKGQNGRYTQYFLGSSSSLSRISVLGMLERAAERASVVLSLDLD